MKTLRHTTYLDDDTEILIEYEQEPFVPAQTYGPPEDCYPAEGGGVYILEIDFKDSDGSWQPYRATEDQIEKWTQEIEERPIEPDGHDPDEWYDRIRDERMGL